MARVFTRNFAYDNKNYTAVITQIDGSVSIYLPDESLHHILPQGRFTYHPGQGLQIDTPKLSPMQNLVLSVLSGLELEMQN